MEGSAAVEIWKRSVERNQLVYSSYIGDGDSSSFKNLRSNPYDCQESFRKEECLGHEHKRLKEHLKKKSNTFPKLSTTKVERVGQVFALVVVLNRGKSPNETQSSLWNLLEHLIKNHNHCPFVNDSWCCYQKRQPEQTESPSLSLPSFRPPFFVPAPPTSDCANIYTYNLSALFLRQSCF